MISIQSTFRKNNTKRIINLFVVLLISQVSLATRMTDDITRLEDLLKQGIVYENYDEIYKEANSLLETAKAKKDYDNIVRINVLLADFFLSKLGQPSSAEKYLFEASKYISKCKNDGIITKFKYIFSKQNYLTKNYKGAKKHLLELIETTRKRSGNELKIGAYYHAIGTIWAEEMQLDSARHYYNISIEVYESVTKDPAWFFIAKHDILALDILEKKFDTDIILRIDHLIKLSKKHNRSSYIIDYQILASEYYIEANHFDQSLLRLDLAMQITDSLNIIESRPDLLLQYSNVYEKLGDYKLALSNFQEYSTLKDSLEIVGSEFRFSTAELLLHNTEVEKESFKIKVKNQQIHSEQKALLMYLSIAILTVILIAITLLIVRNKNKKYRQLSEVNIALKNRELKYKEEELGAFATDIIRRSGFIKEIQSELKKIKNQPNDNKLKEELKTLLTKVNNQNYVNNQLVEIQNKVEDINNNYYLKLGKICPSLTNADKQLCSMIKLDLTQSELAIIFGIETASLKTKKYRLKKKLGLTQDQDMSEYLRTI